MNCIQAQNISIKIVLESFSLFPSKENSKTAFYFAFDREEKTPSLSVDFVKNSAFDFGTGKQYDVISLVQIIKKCSVSEALKYLEKFDSKFQNETFEFATDEKKYEVIAIKKIQHPALIEYLRNRKVECQKNLVEEIHYQINNKNYFGIGFKNDADGFEIRNAYSKICLGKKEISSIKNDSKTVRIFEGFFDFLSFKKIEKFSKKSSSDYIILNSISMVYKLKTLLSNYQNIELFLDNDAAGNKITELFLEQYPGAKDGRTFFKNSKDLNEYLVSKF